MFCHKSHIGEESFLHEQKSCLTFEKHYSCSSSGKNISSESQLFLKHHLSFVMINVNSFLFVMAFIVVFITSIDT